MSVLFVSGIDTGVGKTVATGLMARFLRLRGVSHATVKMVQTGNVGFSEDLDAHRALAGDPRLPEDDEGLTAPQVFAFPSSPELSARLEGRTVDLGAIGRAVAECARRRDVVLVEGAGGLCVPLTRDVLAVDFAAASGWPLVLVTSGRLGSINHTVLSLEAARARGMSVAGVVHNFAPGADPRIDADAAESALRHLRRLGFPEVLVRIPEVRPGEPPPDVDFSPLFAMRPAPRGEGRPKGGSAWAGS